METGPYRTLQTEKISTHAHNGYLETALEWGIPAALAFWVFVLWRLGASVGHFVPGRDPGLRGIALGCRGAILSILLHSAADFNLQIPANAMVFCSILALSFAPPLLRRAPEWSR